ncbi:4-amino-4-deoxy-L-arabinose transferase [Serratia fonticola]|uniref:4-amino-4-deoxy-L-arabinose transferase n=1 Tax=Serratia fonticola TaxID=47917 RepID=A0A4U9WEK0_SERFO|nr:4-amino-4-deoxy-L-arabinose transferase [Serratia fonticola]
MVWRILMCAVTISAKRIFAGWLAQARKQGDVSLVMQLSRGEHVPTDLPPPDSVVEMHRMALVWYKQQP